MRLRYTVGSGPPLAWYWIHARGIMPLALNWMVPCKWILPPYHRNRPKNAFRPWLLHVRSGRMRDRSYYAWSSTVTLPCWYVVRKCGNLHLSYLMPCVLYVLAFLRAEGIRSHWRAIFRRPNLSPKTMWLYDFRRFLFRKYYWLPFHETKVPIFL